MIVILLYIYIHINLGKGCLGATICAPPPPVLWCGSEEIPPCGNSHFIISTAGAAVGRRKGRGRLEAVQVWLRSQTSCTSQHFYLPFHRLIDFDFWLCWMEVSPQYTSYCLGYLHIEKQREWNGTIMTIFLKRQNDKVGEVFWGNKTALKWHFILQ